LTNRFKKILYFYPLLTSYNLLLGVDLLIYFFIILFPDGLDCACFGLEPEWQCDRV